MGFLNKAASGQSGKKKGTHPTVDVSDDMKKMLDEHHKAVMTIKDAEAERAQLESATLPVMEQKLVDECKKAGKVYNAIDAADYMVTFPSKATKMDPDTLPGIKDRLGDKAGNYFKETFKVEMTPAGVEELNKDGSELAAKMQSALGDDFGKYFTVKPVVEPTDSWFNDAMLDDDVRKIANELREQGLVVPFKGSIKQK